MKQTGILVFISNACFLSKVLHKSLRCITILPLELPSFEKSPSLSRHVDRNQVSLLCVFESLSPSHSYFVSWYEDSRLLRTVDTGNETRAVLTEQDMGVLNFGAEVS